MPTCLLCVKSSNGDQNPVRHHKYQKRSGLGWWWDEAHTAALGWPWVNSRLSAGTQCKGRLSQAGAHGAPAMERRVMWLCCFYCRRRNAIFSVVVLSDSLVKLACGYFVTSLQIFIEREGELKAGGVNVYWVCILVQAFSVLKGRLPHPKPMAHSAAEGPQSHGHQVAEMGILSQVSRTSKAAFFPRSYTSQQFRGFN